MLVALEQALGLSLVPVSKQTFHPNGAEAGLLLVHALIRREADQFQKRQPKGQGQTVRLFNGKGRHALPGVHGPFQPPAVKSGSAVAHQLAGKQAHPRRA